MIVAIEAKRYGRKVSIGTVDEFIGKLLDVGCDRGVLYAAGGFTEGALSRASSARNPAVGCVHLEPQPGPAGIFMWLSPLEEVLDRAVGPNRTQTYGVWFSAMHVPLYRWR